MEKFPLSYTDKLKWKFMSVLWLTMAAQNIICYADTKVAGVESINAFYSFIVSITSVTGGLMGVICLFRIMTSKDQKAVSEGIAWLKRIVVAWFSLISLSTIFKIIFGFVGTGTDKIV